MRVTDVYGDLFFMINMSMDYLCLHISAKLLHRRVIPWRLMLAAAIGGVYSVVALILPMSDAWSLVLDIGVCILMCVVAFARRGEGVILPTGIYAVVSMVLGGIMTAIYNLLNRAGLSDQLPSGNDGISAWMFAILAAISGALAVGSGKFFRKSTAARHCTVKITLFGKTVCLDGMCDSGNLMRDPIDGRLAVAVDRLLVKDLLGEKNAQALAVDGVALNISDSRLARRVRVIPAGTAVGNGILIGIVPDGMCITPEGGAEHSVDALFAIIDTGDGAVLVPSQLMV